MTAERDELANPGLDMPDYPRLEDTIHAAI
jgi:hypothetical protein